MSICDLNSLTISYIVKLLLKINLKFTRMTCKISIIKFRMKHFIIFISIVSCKKYHIQPFFKVFIALITI